MCNLSFYFFHKIFTSFRSRTAWFPHAVKAFIKARMFLSSSSNNEETFNIPLSSVLALKPESPIQLKNDEMYWPGNTSGKSNKRTCFSVRRDLGQDWPIFLSLMRQAPEYLSGGEPHEQVPHTSAALGWKYTGQPSIDSNKIPSLCSRKGPRTLEAVGKRWSSPHKDHSSTPTDKPCYQRCGTAVAWAVAARSTWVRPVPHKVIMLSSLESKRLNPQIKCKMHFVLVVECFSNIAKNLAIL